MSITSYAVSHKPTAYVLVLLLFIAGVNAYRVLPLESAPDIEIPIILVQTLYLGVAPTDLEKLVTNVLERELKDLKDVKKLSSSSSESVSIITIEFETDVDMDDAYEKVRDKVDKAKVDLPRDAEDPVLIEINISEFPIMLVNVAADYGMVRLKQVAEDIEDVVEQVPGVLGVDMVGGLEREIQIYLDPNRMEFYELGFGQVISRIQQEHLTTPAGNLELGQSKYTVRIPGEYKDVRLLEDLVLKSPNGNPVKLRDIGRVIDGFAERTTISRTDGIESINLRVVKRAGEDGVRMAERIRADLAALSPTLPTGTKVEVVKDESIYIRDIVTDLENNIISGLLLVLLVLFVAMGLLNASFVALAIPLSMLITFIALRLLGVTLNMVVLFSLILALGMLVDNSIVIIENIYRHASEGTERNLAAIGATSEVAWPVITSTLTTVVAFAPLLFWEGVMGTFMGYLPKTVIIALFASLFVALVINPVTASSFLRTSGKKLFDDSGVPTGPVLGRYHRVLAWSLDHPWWLISASNLLLIVTVMAYARFGSGIEFFPSSTPERAQVSIKAPQGTTLATTDGYMRQVEAFAQTEDNVKMTIANVGYGGGMLNLQSGGGNSHLAVADVEFKDRHERTHSTWDSIEAFRGFLSGLAGGEFKVDVEKHGPPTGAAVSVEISGPDYAVSTRLTREVKELLGTIQGVVDLKDDYEAGKPELVVEIDRVQAKLRGVDTLVISQAVRSAINGTKVSVLREGEEEYDIVVRSDERFRASIADLLDLRVTGKDDVQVPLRDVATVRTTGGLGSIKHIDRRRTILVSADVSGRSSSEVMLEVKALLGEKLQLPPGYFVTYSGEDEHQQEAVEFLSEAFLIGLLLILMILITQFNSVLRPAIIMGSVVMSLIGVLLGLLLFREKFGIIMTGMGVISLAGVVVNNAIVLIDYTDQLLTKHGLPLREALLRAGVTRFRPVLLTAITTILGMLPMALGISIDFTTFSIDTGSSTVEWWGPLARAVSFGLSFATVLTLIMVPVMYLVQARVVDVSRRLFGRILPRQS